MDKRFFLSGIVIAIASLMLGFVVHGLLLSADYVSLPHLFRSEEDSQNYFHFMLLAHLMMGFAFTWIYRKGVEPGKSAVGQGIRYGIGIVVLMTIPMYLIYYAVQPMPGALVLKQIIFDTIGMILLGILVAVLNPPKE